MLLVARKNLFSEHTRLAISVGGVALSVFLISLLLSLYRGWDEKVGSFVEDSDVDIWAGSIGTNDFLTAASIVPLEDAHLLNGVPDIEQWSPIIVRPMTGLKVNVNSNTEEDRKMDLHLIGYDPATGISGPIKIVEGKSAPGPNEVIVDEALASRYDLSLNDTISAGGKRWTVAGISSGGDFVSSQTVFVTLDQAQKALGMENQATFIGMRLRNNVDAKKFAADVTEQVPQAVAFTREDFAASTRDVVLGDLLPILFIVLVLAFVVGLAVSGLTIYTATIEKGREYGIIKAVGFKNSYLYRLVFEQAIVTGALGFAIGVVLTLIFGPIASNQVPQFVTLVRWQDLLVVLAATIVMSMASGYIPVRRLASIDPVEAFKA
jgi:putative ABC transport system permease protein